MDAFEFVSRYQDFISEIEDVVKPEYYPAIERLKSIDPHDIISPNQWFPKDNDALGIVWKLFLIETKKVLQNK